ncbi:MAG TPA: YbdD/YjiX family protein [Steroidobacteraceae bacterium]|nr:YbdD/YjiX family protein [Steroidobacteraceae bacterium]
MSVLVNAWKWLRRLSGDDAYERYLEHARAEHPDCIVWDRARFCREREIEKWTGVKRCC